jgi:hypothetical protein
MNAAAQDLSEIMDSLRKLNAENIALHNDRLALERNVASLRAQCYELSHVNAVADATEVRLRKLARDNLVIGFFVGTAFGLAAGAVVALFV